MKKCIKNQLNNNDFIFVKNFTLINENARKL